MKSTPDHKGFIPVDGCSFSRLSNSRCSDVGHDSPSCQELIVRINLQVERFVDPIAEKGKLWQVLPVVGDPADYHQLLVVIATELWAGELHQKRETRIVLRELGGK